jgi:hypothetical protein
MQRFFLLAGRLSSPALMMIVVWCTTLACVLIGPIYYPMQPSPIVLIVVSVGVVLFVLAHQVGGWSFDRWFKRQVWISEPSPRALNHVVTATSLIGIVGIGLVLLDRAILSGASNNVYSELLRCAPGLVDAISIKRTPLLYLGYVTFSFGFVSTTLFILKGEEIRGWPAALAQLSIVSPVGYALLYSGRMPILIILVLLIAAMLVRFSRGQRPLPGGHQLVVKVIVTIGLFAVYSSSIWSSRQSFCSQTSSLIRELQEEKKSRDLSSAFNQDVSGQIAGDGVRRPKATEVITAADLSKRVAETRAFSNQPSEAISTEAMLAVMEGSWKVKPRGYIISMIEAAHLSERTVMTILYTYFYFTHGVQVIDIAWHARDKLSPQRGLYQIGVLSPILRVFFPDGKQPMKMEAELRSVGIFGFFPTVWTAAFIDFGLIGAIVYILIWGFAAGWSDAGTRRTRLITPVLLLTFVLASILLSPVQGPLGVANSALVLLSMLVTGVALDVATIKSVSRYKMRTNTG